MDAVPEHVEVVARYDLHVSPARRLPSRAALDSLVLMRRDTAQCRHTMFEIQEDRIRHQSKPMGRG